MKVRKMGQDAVVLLHRLAKAKARVKDNVRNTLFRQLGQPFFKERFRVSCRARQHIGYAGQGRFAARHIIYNKERSKATYALRSHRRTEGVNGQSYIGQSLTNSIQRGEKARALFLFRGKHRPWTGRAGTHVKEGSTIGHHLTGTFDHSFDRCGTGSGIKRVGRHIKDAHDYGSAALKCFCKQHSFHFDHKYTLFFCFDNEIR